MQIEVQLIGEEEVQSSFGLFRETVFKPLEEVFDITFPERGCIGSSEGFLATLYTWVTIQFPSVGDCHSILLPVRFPDRFMPEFSMIFPSVPKLVGVEGE